ncbi:MAG: hypothetical protein K2X81_09440, partial [Candidatus Obscuribacterales bacterium]|nr:hypothetical protein [Candidatus Obscuribacterales bacterium]
LAPVLTPCLFNASKEGIVNARNLLKNCIVDGDITYLRQLPVLLIPLISSENELKLLDPVWNVVASNDVKALLSVLMSNEILNSTKSFWNILAKLSTHFPEECRAWCRQSEIGNSVIASRLLSMTYEKSFNGFESLLEQFRVGSAPFQSIIEYVRMQEDNPEDWIFDVLRKNEAIATQLVTDGCATSGDSLVRFLSLFIGELSQSVQLTFILQLQKLSSDDASSNDIAALCLLKVLLGSYHDKSEKLLEMERSTWFEAWLGKTRASNFVRAFDSQMNGSITRWNNCWLWLENCPEPVSHRNDTALKDVISLLLTNRHQRSMWSNVTSTSWSQLLLCLETVNPPLHLELCSQALQFSLSNIELPLSRLVVVSFRVVYAAMERGELNDWPGYTGLFTIFGWDKCKELRRKLVESFRKSNWPPKDLALAIRDRRLLSKIIKKMKIDWSGSDKYVKRMQDQLACDSTPDAAKALIMLNGIINDDHSEDWY